VNTIESREATPELKDDSYLSEVADALKSLVKSNENYYKETLILNDAGQLSTAQRIGDSHTPYLPNVLRSLPPEFGSPNPTDEDVYKLLYALERKLPDYTFDIFEDRSREWIRYSITKKG
jgi:hypothetical protein